MATPEFLKPGARPSSPATTAWFEYLLSPDLLVKNLNRPQPVPSPNQLIIQFLQQAYALEANQAESKKTDTQSKENQTEQLKDDSAASNPEDPQTEENQYYKRKAKALKLLALKIAAHGGWNLDSLMKDIPGPVVLQLLQELQIFTCGKLEESDETLIEMLTQTDHSDVAFFSLLLYQRWCVLTVLQDCLPKKPVRVNSIPVPGLTELVVQMVGISEEKMAKIKKLFGKCKSTLSERLNMERNVCIPTHECFGFANTAMGDVRLDWSLGLTQGAEFWGKKIAFDLGSIYFYETDYYKALDTFSKVETWHKISGGDDIDVPKLTGYLKACNGLVNNIKYESCTINLFNEAFLNKDLIKLKDVLSGDLKANKLAATAADQIVYLLQTIRDENIDSLSILHMELDCLCCAMYTRRGDPYYFIVTNPKLVQDRSQYLINYLSVASECATRTDQQNIQSYLEYLVDTEGDSMRTALLDNEVIKNLYGSELTSMGDTAEEMDTADNTGSSLLDTETYDTHETSLVLSYNPDNIWALLCKIHATGNLKVVVDIWKLPKDLDRLFNELKMDLTTVCAYVLIAKAKELISMQDHDEVVVLLTAAERTIRDISGKIAKIIRWEILYSHLLSAKTNTTKQPIHDIDKKVKSALHSLKVDSDVYPHDSLVMECVSYLLLSKDWEYLSSLHDTRVAYTEYARQVINVCKELPNVKYARTPGKVLWDTSIVIFSLQNTGKRARLGNQAMFPKDTYKKFILTINEPLVLSVLISLLTRVYSLKNTDNDIDRTNDFSSVWPDTIPPNIDEVYVKELMIQLVQQALQINPLQATWLKTYAEIQFAVGNLQDALKYYLQAASVASNHFMQPIPFYVFDAEVYTRLVKCCVQLKNFTQAAILSQFFEQPDYIAIFKYLQEKNCQDGMDMYYDCLYDTDIMEFLVHLHDKRGELDKKQRLILMIGNPEINSNNPDAILQTVKAHRKSQFFRILTKQYC